MNSIKRNFSMSTFPYNFDPNETLISRLHDFYSINCLTVYRAYITHHKVPICEFSKEPKNFNEKFRMLRHFIYSFILMHFISPVNG